MRVLTLAFVLLPLLALLLLASTCCSLVKRLTQISWTSSSEKWTAIYFGGASDFAGENKEARKLGDRQARRRGTGWIWPEDRKEKIVVVAVAGLARRPARKLPRGCKAVIRATQIMVGRKIWPEASKS